MSIPVSILCSIGCCISISPIILNPIIPNFETLDPRGFWLYGIYVHSQGLKKHGVQDLFEPDCCGKAHTFGSCALEAQKEPTISVGIENPRELPGDEMNP